MAGQSNDYFKEFDKIFKETSDFMEQVNKVKEAIDSISKSQVKINNNQALKNISETQKALNQIKQSIVITIDAKNAVKENINNIKSDLKSVVTKPFTVVIEAKNQTKKVIDGIKNNITNLKSKVLSDNNKKIFNSTIGEAMKSEDRFMALKTNLHSEEEAKKAFQWANDNSQRTQFTSSEVIDSVAKLASSGLDYEKFFRPLGDLATAKNKSINDAIEAMSKLSGGNLKDATSDFSKLGITKDMWEKQGIKVDKDGVIQGDSKQAMDAAVKIIDSNWKEAMKNKSNTASGQIKNIKEAFAGLGTSLVGMKDNGEIEKGGVFDTFKQQLEKIVPLLDKFKGSDAFKSIQKDLSDLVSVAGSKFSNFIDNLMKDPDKLKQYFDTLSQSIHSGVSIIRTFGSVLGEIITKLKPLFSLIEEHPKLFADLFLGFATFKAGSSLIKGGLDSFKSVKDVIKDINSLKNSIGALFGGGKGIGKGIGGTIKSIFGEGKLQFKLFKDMIKKDSKSSLSNISKFFNSVSGTTKLWSGVIGNVIKNNFTNAFKTLKSTLKGFSIIKPLQEAAKNFKNLGVMKEMPKALSAAFKPLKTVFSTLGEVVKTVFTGMVKVIGRFFAFMMANPLVAIILIIVAAVILLYEAWKNNWFGIRDKAKAAMDAIKTERDAFVEDMRKAWDRLKEFFSHPIDATIRFIKEGNHRFENDPTKKNALGTSYFSGGWTWIGEQGPELMKLPGGTQILDNRTSQNMLGGSVSVEKLADTLVVREDADIDRIADALAKKLTKVGFNCV